MNKRKIALLAMSACMIAILAIGGTLAYFTDTDSQTNVFTTGNVAIDLFEDFGDNNADTLEKLMPAGKDAEGNTTNIIEKEVYVENTGSEPAYVRVHFAIPDILDSGAKDVPALKASDNIVHFNMARASFAEGKWSWLPEYTATGDGYKGNGEGNWNVYQTEIDNITYNVYVITYRTAITKGQITEDAVNQVYMDSKVTNAQIEELKKTLKDEWKIYVAAEACQAQGFDDAYTALNTAFGKPGTYTPAFTWGVNNEGSKDFLQRTSVKGLY